MDLIVGLLFRDRLVHISQMQESCSRSPSTSDAGGGAETLGRLTRRQRLSWITHLAKATLRRHHRSLTSTFKRYIPTDATVLDVGAHAGQFSKLFAGLASGGRVYAFEPSNYARSILIRALRWNRIENVEILPFGLSDVSGTAILKTPLTASGSLGFGRARFSADVDGVYLSQPAMLRTLDDFVKARDLTRIDFIKIDVEGWEMHVLRGGLRSLERFRPTLFLEVSEEWLAHAGEAPEAIWGLLTQLGYGASRLGSVNEEAPSFTPTSSYAGSGDYLFTMPDVT